MSDKTQLNPLDYDNYFEYFTDVFKTTSFGKIINGMIVFLRKTLLFSRILKYFRIILMYIQTGAFVIFSATVIIILIPSVVIFILICTFASLFRFKRLNKKFLKLFGKNNIYILFQSSKNDISYDFENKDKPAPENSLIIFVYKSLLNKAILGSYKDKKGYYHINMLYFYCLKKHVIDKYKISVNYKL